MLILVMTLKIIVNDSILTNDDDIVSLLYQYSGYEGVIEGVIRGLLGEVMKVLKLIFPTIFPTIFYNYFLHIIQYLQK